MSGRTQARSSASSGESVLVGMIYVLSKPVSIVPPWCTSMQPAESLAYQAGTCTYMYVCAQRPAGGRAAGCLPKIRVLVLLYSCTVYSTCTVIFYISILLLVC